jgi:hypothetical protein
VIMPVCTLLALLLSDPASQPHVWHLPPLLDLRDLRKACTTHSASTATTVTTDSASTTVRIVSIVFRRDWRYEVSTAAAVRVSLVMLAAACA